MSPGTPDTELQVAHERSKGGNATLRDAYRSPARTLGLLGILLVPTSLYAGYDAWTSLGTASAVLLAVGMLAVAAWCLSNFACSITESYDCRQCRKVDERYVSEDEASPEKSTGSAVRVDASPTEVSR